MLTPEQIHRANIQHNSFIVDPSQELALGALNKLHSAILAGCATTDDSVYLWGSVGRGKSYLMDCFYQSLAEKVAVKRMHYYRFMQYLHGQLKHHQGKKEPLSVIAKDFVGQQKILCLDEFFVNDIADAMLLGRLLKHLFEQGLILVTTSNVVPSELYLDGLQRDRFLPAIRMLEKHLNIIHMQGDTDHRLAKAKHSHYYQVEPSFKALEGIQDSRVFQLFRQGFDADSIVYQEQLTIESRSINTLAKCARSYCFSFEQLFIGPRSANDYIALAKLADTLFIFNVPQMGGLLQERKVARGTEDTHDINQRVANRPFVLAKGDDEARRFISFIDEMYDQNKRVVIAAEVPLEQLYLGGHVAFEFARTFSRIIEMQSDDY